MSEFCVPMKVRAWEWCLSLFARMTGARRNFATDRPLRGSAQGGGRAENQSQQCSTSGHSRKRISLGNGVQAYLVPLQRHRTWSHYARCPDPSGRADQWKTPCLRNGPRSEPVGFDGCRAAREATESCGRVTRPASDRRQGIDLGPAWRTWLCVPLRDHGRKSPRPPQGDRRG